MRTIGIVDATDRGSVVGRHSIWLPDLEIKMPFQWSGLITKYRHHEPGYTPHSTLPHEIAILRALAAEGMAPPIGDVVRVDTIVSEHCGAWHADPCGGWAYEMADATRLPPGAFSIDEMRALPIQGSPGAWGDVAKPGNVVNGYLVDVRRSGFDMLRWTGPGLRDLPVSGVDVSSLRARVHRECQFPAGERAMAYQDFWIAGVLERGQRRVEERARALGFHPKSTDTVLDIGCQSGGFLQYAALNGATGAGVDVSYSYIDCARALARSCGQNLCFRQMDVVHDRPSFLDWVRDYFPGRRPTYCLALSLEKHLGEWPLFSLIDAIGAQTTFIETNAIPSESHLKMWEHVLSRDGKHVGYSRDRNLRALYRIDRRSK